MTHGQKRLRLAHQQVLEPQNALEVEVVRGLVEQQQLGLPRQLARDHQALLPAAGERVDRLGAVRESGLAERDSDACVDLVLVEMFFPHGLAEHCGHCRASREARVLRDVTEPQAFASRAVTG